jgi:hypothetical protein
VLLVRRGAHVRVVEALERIGPVMAQLFGQTEGPETGRDLAGPAQVGKILKADIRTRLAGREQV